MAQKLKSIITQDLEHCYLCGAPNPQIHHIFNGSMKRKSERFGLIMPLCMNHHTGPEGVHTIPGKIQLTKEFGQIMFELYYPGEDFLKIFGKNYKTEPECPAGKIFEAYNKIGGKQ